MTIYKFPPAGKTLYGLTTGTVYRPCGEPNDPLWDAGDTVWRISNIAHHEPDGVTDVRPAKAGDIISTEEELDALPNGAILRHESGVWEKCSGRFFTTGSEDLFDSSELIDDNALTVLWLPEEAC